MRNVDKIQGGAQSAAAKKRAPAAKLPIPTLQTARALILMYGRLKGELDKSARGEAVLIHPGDAELHMSRIIGLMPLLGVDFDPTVVKTVRTRIQVGPLDWGNLRTGTLTVLRAHGGWMSYREIAEALLARNRKQQTLDVAGMSRFVQKVRESLFFQTKGGLVERESDIGVGESDLIQRFSLSRTKFRQ